MADAPLPVLALVFSILFIWSSRNTGQEHWYQTWGPFLLAAVAFLIGIPVYRSMRSRMAPPPVPPCH
jgi:basic amino acid/polyamine antiporter, APA family